MEMKQCPSGHFYDASKNASCPYCKSAGVPAPVAPIPKPVAPVVNEPLPGTVPLYPDAPAESAGHTVSIYGDFNPVVGWLVCVSGPDKGKQYVIHSDRNFIGRDERADIRILHDDSVSRESAILTYDSESRKFYCMPDRGRAIVRRNDVKMSAEEELTIYDRISIGNTVLMFVPLCGDAFDWDWEQEKQ